MGNESNSSRFRPMPSPAGLGGEDALEHCAIYPHQRSVIQKWLKKTMHPQTISFFLGLGAIRLENMAFHAYHVYAVKRAIDTRRYAPGNARSTFAQLVRLNWHVLILAGLSVKPPRPTVKRRTNVAQAKKMLSLGWG